MDEKILLRISLAVSFLGLLILFIILSFFTVEEKSISEIHLAEEESTVKIKGFAESVENKEGLAIIEVAELKSVKAIIFTDKNITLEKNQKVEIVGKIRNYKGKKEVIVDRIKRI